MEHHIKYLFDKYKSGQLSPTEQLEWEVLLNNEQYNAVVASLFDEEWNRFQASPLTDVLEQQLKFNIDFILNFPQKQRKTRKIRSYYWAAAIALICCGLTIWLYLWKMNEEIIPGTNKAYITLADGRKIELSDHAAGIEMKDGKMKYSGDTGLLFKDVNMSAENLLLVTPRGGQYKVKLPDGTQVFLNAASSLSYPSNFANAKQRLVYLKGEGYFEVAHDKDRPFIVKSDNQKVQVLGTKFNLNTYQPDEAITTLLDGRVKIILDGEVSTVSLYPGQQAITQKNRLQTHEVRADDYIGWTQNVFIFNDTPLSEIMQQLERWYNVEVVYPSDFVDERFFAEIPRKRMLSQVLGDLQNAGNFKFEIQGRRIILTK